MQVGAGEGGVTEQLTRPRPQAPHEDYLGVIWGGGFQQVTLTIPAARARGAFHLTKDKKEDEQWEGCGEVCQEHPSQPQKSAVWGRPKRTELGSKISAESKVGGGCGVQKGSLGMALV